jgi:ferritin-like metal-binding protein YciE
MKLESLRDLFIEQLRDLYSAESQLLKALPKMSKKATSSELKASFDLHLEETERQKENLDRVFEILGEKPTGHTCKAMKGIIEEGEELMKEDAVPEVLDAGLIAAAQRVEHYEIAGYGTVREYARELGETEIEGLLTKILNEEKRTDKKLTVSAESGINEKAEAGDNIRSSRYQFKGGSSGSGKGSRAAGNSQSGKATSGRSSGRNATSKTSANKSSGSRSTGAKTSSGKGASGKAATGRASASNSTGAKKTASGSRSKSKSTK